KTALYDWFKPRRQHLLKRLEDLVASDGQKKNIFMQMAEVNAVTDFEPFIKSLSDQALRDKTHQFKQKLAAGESLDDIMCEAFAVVREAAWRAIRKRPYDTQVYGGIQMHQGRAIEMASSEGKTLAAVLPAYLNALTGRGVHIVTWTENLAKRDAQHMGKIFDFLEMRVGVVTRDGAYQYNASYQGEGYYSRLEPLGAEGKQMAYFSNIVYGAMDVFVFDYLEDQFVKTSKQKVQPSWHPALTIVDEVDSILIDEIIHYLILTNSLGWDAPVFYALIRMITAGYKEGREYRELKKEKAVELTSLGRKKTQRAIDRLIIDLHIWGKRFKRSVNHNGVMGLEASGYNICKALLDEDHYAQSGKTIRVTQLNARGRHDLSKYFLELARITLEAGIFFRKGIEYVRRGDGVKMVDEFTGECKTDHIWGDRLQQVIEDKEGVSITPVYETLTMTTYRHYFSQIGRLAAMSGTIGSQSDELLHWYGLKTVAVPRNKPCRRKDMGLQIVVSKQEKLRLIVKKIIHLHKNGIPVLVGLPTVAEAEECGRLLKERGLSFNMISAKHYQHEAEVVAYADEKWAITIGTNKIGRGIDIKGEVFLINGVANKNGRGDIQLINRVARNGAEGYVWTVLSLEEEVFQIFAPDEIISLAQKLETEEAILGKEAMTLIKLAQKRSEKDAFERRLASAQWDSFFEEQASIYYHVLDLHRGVGRKLNFDHVVVRKWKEYIYQIHELRKRPISPDTLQEISQIKFKAMIVAFFVSSIKRMPDDILARVYDEIDWFNIESMVNVYRQVREQLTVVKMEDEDAPVSSSLSRKHPGLSPKGIREDARLYYSSNPYFNERDIEVIKDVLSVARGQHSQKSYSWEGELFELLALRLGIERTVLEVGLHKNHSAKYGMLAGGVQGYISIDYYNHWPLEYQEDVREYRKALLSGESDYEGPMSKKGYNYSHLQRRYLNSEDRNISVVARHLSAFKLGPLVKGITDAPVQAVIFNHSLGYIGMMHRVKEFSKRTKQKRMTKVLINARNILERNGWIIIKAGSYALYGDQNAVQSQDVMIPILKKIGFKNILVFPGGIDCYFDKRVPPNSLILAQWEKDPIGFDGWRAHLKKLFQKGVASLISKGSSSMQAKNGNNGSSSARNKTAADTVKNSMDEFLSLSDDELIWTLEKILPHWQDTGVDWGPVERIVHELRRRPATDVLVVGGSRAVKEKNALVDYYPIFNGKETWRNIDDDIQKHDFLYADSFLRTSSQECAMLVLFENMVQHVFDGLAVIIRQERATKTGIKYVVMTAIDNGNGFVDKCENKVSIMFALQKGKSFGHNGNDGDGLWWLVRDHSQMTVVETGKELVIMCGALTRHFWRNQLINLYLGKKNKILYQRESQERTFGIVMRIYFCEKNMFTISRFRKEIVARLRYQFAQREKFWKNHFSSSAKEKKNNGSGVNIVSSSVNKKKGEA
ncbi:helicase-related protein, partial [Candidatus Omnitrophota bacterium]